MSKEIVSAVQSKYAAGRLRTSRFINPGDYDYRCAAAHVGEFFERNVYEKIDQALSNFFRRGNLVALRELALRKTYDAVPEPRIVIAVGACAIDGGVFADSYAVTTILGSCVVVCIWDPASQIGGINTYDTWAHVVSLIGSQPIQDAALVVESGYAGYQAFQINSATVNDNTYTGSSSVSTPFSIFLVSRSMKSICRLVSVRWPLFPLPGKTKAFSLASSLVWKRSFR